MHEIDWGHAPLTLILLSEGLCECSSDRLSTSNNQLCYESCLEQPEKEHTQ